MKCRLQAALSLNMNLDESLGMVTGHMPLRETVRPYVRKVNGQ